MMNRTEVRRWNQPWGAACVGTGWGASSRSVDCGNGSLMSGRSNGGKHLHLAVSGERREEGEAARRLEAQAVQRSGAIFPDRGHMLRGLVALMAGEAVFRVKFVPFAHHAITVHLG